MAQSRKKDIKLHLEYSEEVSIKSNNSLLELRTKCSLVLGTCSTNPYISIKSNLIYAYMI